MSKKEIPTELLHQIASTFGMTLDEALHGRGQHDKRLRADVRAAIIYTAWAEAGPINYEKWLDEVDILEENARQCVRNHRDRWRGLQDKATLTPYAHQSRWWIGLNETDQRSAIVHDTARRLTRGEAIQSAAVNNLILYAQ